MKKEEEFDKIEDFEEVLKRKFDEVVVPDYMFDTSKIFKRVQELKKKRRRRFIRIASIVVIILVASLAVVSVHFIKNDGKVDNVGATEGNEGNDAEKGSAIVGKVNLDLFDLNMVNQEFDNVCSVKVKEILGYEIIDGVPSTRLKAQVLDNYYNNVEGDVEMIVPGGVFTVKEIIKGVNTNNNEEIKKYKEEDKVGVTCYNEIYIPMAEKGKVYLTTLDEKDGVFYVCNNLKYGFKEFDAEKIK